MPLAKADADSISSSRGLAICTHILSWPPTGSLIPGASTGFHLGHLLAGVERSDAQFRAQGFQLLLVEADQRPDDSAVRFDQEHGRHVRETVGVAGRITVARAIEQ